MGRGSYLEIEWTKPTDSANIMPRNITERERKRNDCCWVVRLSNSSSLGLLFRYQRVSAVLVCCFVIKGCQPFWFVVSLSKGVSHFGLLFRYQRVSAVLVCCFVIKGCQPFWFVVSLSKGVGGADLVTALPRSCDTPDPNAERRRIADVVV
jgi:hypothetical protein